MTIKIQKFNTIKEDNRLYTDQLKLTLAIECTSMLGVFLKLAKL